MTAARKQWTDAHQRQLRHARLAAGVSDVAFARDNSLALRHLQQLEEGGSSAFYSESIKYDMGVKLLKRLGVDLPAEPEPSSLSGQTPLAAAPESVAETPVSAERDAAPAPAAIAATALTRRPSYVVLSLVGLGLIGAGISLIPSIHPPGPAQGVTQSSEVVNLTKIASAGAAGPSTADDTPPTTGAASVPDVAPAVSVIPAQSLSDLCDQAGSAQTIVPSQPSKAPDYVYVTAVSDVTVCVRDTSGRITRKSLQAGQSPNIPGQQPFDVTADQLHQLRVFFQGQRIWFQAEATRLRLTAATASD
jgi:hypothetical protein